MSHLTIHSSATSFATTIADFGSTISSNVKQLIDRIVSAVSRAFDAILAAFGWQKQNSENALNDIEVKPLSVIIEEIAETPIAAIEHQEPVLAAETAHAPVVVLAETTEETEETPAPVTKTAQKWMSKERAITLAAKAATLVGTASTAATIANIALGLAGKSIPLIGQVTRAIALATTAYATGTAIVQSAKTFKANSKTDNAMNGLKIAALATAAAGIANNMGLIGRTAQPTDTCSLSEAPRFSPIPTQDSPFKALPKDICLLSDAPQVCVDPNIRLPAQPPFNATVFAEQAGVNFNANPWGKGNLLPLNVGFTSESAPYSNSTSPAFVQSSDHTGFENTVAKVVKGTLGVIGGTALAFFGIASLAVD